MDTITIVCPWYGPDTAGGAETQARQLAIAIRQQGAPVEVWTTTGRDSFHPPEQYYPVGPTTLDNIPLERFPLTPPSLQPTIPPIIRRLKLKLPTFPEHELRLLASLVSSDALLDAIATRRERRRFVFIPYPFPTSFWGSAIAGERAYLLPCLHDEPYAYYNTYAWMFRRAQRVLANSAAERELVLRLYQLPAARVVMAGEGIDLTPTGDGAAFRAHYNLHGPLLLYVGRRDETKNIPLLLSYIREYWAQRGAVCTLLLAGRDPLDLPPSLGGVVRDLGFITAQTKHDAYAAVDLFVHPSLHESFSIVLMEAWLQGTPALVHADCAVTRRFAEESGGGLTFGDFMSFAQALDQLLADSTLRHTLGQRGQAWVQANCRWDEVARRTIAAVQAEGASLDPAT
jgi:glycosyltransferase involved in cell wall biosynthesis